MRKLFVLALIAVGCYAQPTPTTMVAITSTRIENALKSADTGTANAYVGCDPFTTTPIDGLLVMLTPANNNTGASTLNWCSSGALPIQVGAGAAISGGAIFANSSTVPSHVLFIFSAAANGGAGAWQLAGVVGSSGGSGDGAGYCVATNTSQNALECGTVAGFTPAAGALLDVSTASLTNYTSTTSPTITVNGDTYTLLLLSGAGPTAGTIGPNTPAMLISLGVTTATIMSSGPAFDSTMTCSSSPPFPCGVNVSDFFQIGSTNTATGYTDMHNGAFRPPEKTVSGLPSASASTGQAFKVTDGASSTDCTTGGGSTLVNDCRSNGSAWVYEGGGGGGTSFNPLDVTTIWWDDPWIGGTLLLNTSGVSGRRWNAVGNNNTAVPIYVSTDANHGSALELTFGDTSGIDLEYVLSTVTAYAPGATANWTLQNIMKTSASSTGVATLTGIAFGASGVCRYNVDSNCMGIVYYPATSANWIVVECVASAACAYQDTGVAYANGTWFLFKLFSTSAGTIKGQVNSGTLTTYSGADVYTGALPISPWGVVSSAGLASYSWLVNKTTYFQTGATRP